MKLQFEFNSADEVVDLLQKVKDFFNQESLSDLADGLKNHTDALQMALETQESVSK